MEATDITTDYIQCDLCDVACTDVDYLKRHKRAKHNEDIFASLEGLVFNCLHCAHSTSSKQGLSEHVRWVHNQEKLN